MIPSLETYPEAVCVDMAPVVVISRAVALLVWARSWLKASSQCPSHAPVYVPAASEEILRTIFLFFYFARELY